MVPMTTVATGDNQRPHPKNEHAAWTGNQRHEAGSGYALPQAFPHADVALDFQWQLLDPIVASQCSDTEEIEQKKKQAKKTEQAPQAASDAAKDKGKVVYPQAIALLKSKINEARKSGNMDPQARQAILIGALNNAQWLIKSCVNDFSGGDFPADAAGYITDLGNMHHQILQSLSSVPAGAAQSGTSKTMSGSLENSSVSPFRV